MRKFITLIVAAWFIAILSGCSSPSVPSTSPVKAPTAAATATQEVQVVEDIPVAWNGVWVSDPEFMSAKIVGDLITIDIVTTDSKSLFWKGTWPVATKAAKDNETIEIASKGDVEALGMSIMGSSEKIKTFTYKDGEITFEFSMMGTTKTVHVKK